MNDLRPRQARRTANAALLAMAVMLTLAAAAAGAPGREAIVDCRMMLLEDPPGRVRAAAAAAVAAAVRHLASADHTLVGALPATEAESDLEAAGPPDAPAPVRTASLDRLAERLLALPPPAA